MPDHGNTITPLRLLPGRTAATAMLLALFFTGGAHAFGYPGSNMGPGAGIPGFSSPFSGMPGGFPGSYGGFPGGSNSFPGFSNSFGDWPDISGKLPGFSRIFPDFSFSRRDYGPGRGCGGDNMRRRPYRYLPDWLGRRVRPGAGAMIYDMAFVEDRGFRRMRMIVVQTTTDRGMLAQRCVQYSLAPIMSCQARLNGQVSRSYTMPPPPVQPRGFGPGGGNGMTFSSTGHWRGMTVHGNFRYIPGRSYF